MGKRKPKEESAETVALRNAEKTASLLRLCLRDLVNGTAPFAFETVSYDGGIYILRLFGHNEYSGGRLLVSFGSSNLNQRLTVDAYHLDSFDPPTDHALYAAWRKLLTARDNYFNSPEFFAQKGA